MNPIYQRLLTTAALYCLSLLGGCDQLAKEPEAASVTIERTARLHRVTRSTNALRHRLVGRVDAVQSVEVSFEIGGTLAAFPAREGETQAAGTTLAQLDRQAYALRVQEAAVQLKLARQDHDRKASLLRRGGISRSVVDDAETLMELRRVQLAQARKALADTELVAPFDAYLAERRVDVGAVVAPGQSIMRINDLSELVVLTSVPERLLATLTPERVAAVEARFDFAPEQRFPLRYREHQGETAQVGQAYEVAFLMERPDDLNLLPGMTASVLLELADSKAASSRLWIPSGAVTSDAAAPFLVWRFDPLSRQVERAPVELEPAGDGRFLVLAGLAEGELIVSAGSQALRAGMRVRPLNDTDLAARP